MGGDLHHRDNRFSGRDVIQRYLVGSLSRPHIGNRHPFWPVGGLLVHVRNPRCLGLTDRDLCLALYRSGDA